MNVTTPTLKFSTSCHDISIFSFDKITETGDLRYMVQDYIEGEFELTQEEQLKAYDLFRDILSEYFFLTNDKKVEKNLRLEEKITSLEFKCNIANKIIDLYNNSKEEDSYEILYTIKELGFKLDTNLSIEDQIKNVVFQIKLLNNKININKIALSGYKKDSKDKKEDLETSAINLEVALKLSYQIDTKKTSLHRWICLTKALKN